MTAYYNEHDRYAAQWLRNLIDAGHIARGVVDERDIRAVHPADLDGFTQCHFFAGIGVWSHALRLAGWPDDRPVWTGSCPCQPFSAAGAGAAFDDERHLWPHWFHLIQAAKPKAVPVFGEQVASTDGLAWLDLVHADLEGAGYTVGAVDTCAAGVGAPHIRQRLYFVADPLPAGRAERGHERAAIERSGRAGALAYAACAGRQCIGRGEVHRGRQAGPHAGHHHEGRETNGFWRDADWIACRDGKARPVEPGTFPLAHGAAGRVVRVCPSCLQKGSIDENLRRLLEADGRHEGREPSEVLLHGVHGEGLHETTSDCGRRPLSGAALLRSKGLRDVLRDEPPGEASPRRGRHEQRAVECGDLVSTVSFEDAHEADAAFDMRSLQDPLHSGKPPEPKQDLFCGLCGRMGAHLREATLGTNRVGRLRAYGNAIVAQVAAEFIGAYLDVSLPASRPPSRASDSHGHEITG